jgi:hypothetical protein
MKENSMFKKSSLTSMHPKPSVLGMNLTEIALVLSIVGLVLGAVWAAANQFYAAGNIRRAGQQILLITQNMRGLFADQGGVTGANGAATNQVLDQLKIFPLEMRTNQAAVNGNVVNPWAGIVRTAADDCTGVETSANPQACFGITYQSVPQDACIRLLDKTAQAGIGLVQVTISNVNGNTTLTPSVNPTAARNACTARVNSLQWVYLLRQG